MSCHTGSFLGFGSLLPLLLLGFIVYLIFARTISKRPNEEYVQAAINSGANVSPMEILNRKFASGEISESKYLRKKDLLRQ